MTTADKIKLANAIHQAIILKTNEWPSDGTWTAIWDTVNSFEESK